MASLLFNLYNKCNDNTDMTLIINKWQILILIMLCTIRGHSNGLNTAKIGRGYRLNDHLEGVKIERNGRLNSQFRKEVVLEESDENAQDYTKQLKKIFRRADRDHDNELSHKELTSWITIRVNEHLDKASKDNIHIFMKLDNDHNGIVTWDEYHQRFLLENQINETYVHNHSEKHKDLNRQIREEIVLDRMAFFEAALTNSEGLNIDEYLNFRHPELSRITLLNMVQDIFEKLDSNEDDHLNLEEFVSLNQNDMPISQRLAKEVWEKEREREFREVIDTDRDGQITRQELVMYADPRNPAHAALEARSLMDSVDSNENGKLSLQEMLEHKDIILGSKMVDIAKKFHDEF